MTDYLTQVTNYVLSLPDEPSTMTVEQYKSSINDYIERLKDIGTAQ